MTTNSRRVAAQVACEAIINHPFDGWDRATMEHVWREAIDAGVFDATYTRMLKEAITALGTEADSCPHGVAWGRFCANCLS